MPLSGTPAPAKRKKSTKMIIELTQDVLEQTEKEASKLNLGKKISIPKDIMLEELSLLSNKGSKMFKLRQKRVEKFIYENNPDVFNAQSMDNFQKFVPTLGGQMGAGQNVIQRSGMTITGTSVGQSKFGKQLQGPVPPPRPGDKARSGAVGTGVGQAGGAGGTGSAVIETTDVLIGQGMSGGEKAHGEGKTKVTVIKTYISPWEQAMGNNLDLKATLKASMPALEPRGDLPKYKCFNRTAMPYGGYEMGAKLMTFQLPDFEPPPPEPEPAVVYPQDITSRPSFNRTPVGWIGTGNSSHHDVEVDVGFDGETEEL
ncbi:myozenin-1a [Latimeria chalumnae]|uniref:Myozenin 1 n=1 Tax=Latimeria chalumnae TaxID=7897 RepID=H3ACZ2_LATCH|nr:PREDICTED: myozenin-1 [Latimeria chalumnae]|eukprot:XP_006004988.1 PREDICTED: myozenin-1 [Latimeria chalumnae]